MQGRIIFLLEEPSMRTLLDGLLPRIFPGWIDGEHFQCVPHEGKSDLDRSIPRKLLGWRIPGDRFVIVRDTDGANCLAVKAKVVEICTRAARPDSLVRLVCQELESWYLGDLAALAAALDAPEVNSARNRKRFADPDSWLKPSKEVQRLTPSFQKIGGARALAQHLSIADNRSHSFGVFVAGVTRMAREMGLK